MSRDRRSRSWDPVSEWYQGWVGDRGSRHHRQLAIPALMDLIRPEAGEKLLDLGCGTGALSRTVMTAGASYTGVDLSPRLVQFARRSQPRGATFLEGDATRLSGKPTRLNGGAFDAVTFLLSIQDIAPLSGALESAAWALRPDGRIALLMTHPCFRVPRQSGWGWDERRRLAFRRVDRYLTPLDVPMKQFSHNGRQGATRSYHRPLQDYTDALAAVGFGVARLVEVPGLPTPRTPPPESGRRGASRGEGPQTNEDIPLFLGILAVRLSGDPFPCPSPFERGYPARSTGSLERPDPGLRR